MEGTVAASVVIVVCNLVPAFREPISRRERVAWFVPVLVALFFAWRYSPEQYLPLFALSASIIARIAIEGARSRRRASSER